MSDLIDRQATLKHIEKIRQDALMLDDTHRANILMTGMHLCEEAVRNQPSVQPERKKGKWMVSYLEHEAAGIRPKLLYCSECCQCIAYSTNFCPNCGARMVQEGEQDADRI